MPDEVTGQPVSTETAPEGKSDAPAVPDKFEGKSREDIAKAYSELESKLGQQGSEIGNYKTQLAQTQGQLQQIAAYVQQQEMMRQQAAQRPPEAQASKTNVPFNWEKPEDSVGAIADAKVREAVGQVYRQLRTEQAMTNAPHLFQGTTANEVRNFMRTAIQSGQVAPNAIENPDMWVYLAYVMNGQKTGFGANAPTMNPVTPDESDRPSGAKKRSDDDGGDAIELTREHEDAIKSFGLDKDKFIKELRAERKGKGRR